MAVEPSSGQSKILLLANAIANKITSLITVHNADSSAHSTILTNYIQKSSTSGLVKNDGSIDTTSYMSSLPSHTHPHEDISFTGSGETWQGLGIGKNIGQALDYLMSLVELNSSALKQDKVKLDNLSYDSDWQEVTFKSGYSRYDNSTSVYVRRKGNLVELAGVWKTTSKKTAASNPVAFASIPNKLKPTKSISFICPGQGKHTYKLTVDTDGSLKWSQYGTNSSIDLETGRFGHACCMWII